MSIWTINGTEFPEAGVKSPVRNRASLAVSTFSFTIDGRNVDEELLYNYGDTVTISYDSTKFFVGRVISPQVAGSGGAENHDYTLADGWWDLEHIPLQQLWTVQGGDATAYKGRCILGMDIAGSRQTVGETIAWIVAYAVGKGANLQAGTIDVGLSMPPEEVRDLMCSEAIRRLLRLCPDAASWIDYSTSPPTLNIARRGALDAVSIGLTALDNSGFQLSPRPDLVPGSVTIKYEITRQVDGEQVIDVVTETAGGGTPGGIGSIVQTIPINGGSVDRSWLKQAVKVRTMEFATNGASLADRKRRARWWAGLLGLTGKINTLSGDATTPDIAFFPLETGGPLFRRRLARPDGVDGTGPYELTDPADPESVKIRVNTALDRELIEGTVTPWMGPAVKAQAQEIDCRISFTYIGKSFAQTPEIWTIQVMATNALNQVYSQLDKLSVTLGEDIPIGLAADLLSARSALPWEGSVARLEEECSGWVRPGHVLNISGGATAWATMNAVVQQVTENLETGLTTVTLGHGEHLAPQSLLEAQRMMRRAEGSTGQRDANVQARKTGFPS